MDFLRLVTDSFMINTAVKLSIIDVISL